MNTLHINNLTRVCLALVVLGMLLTSCRPAPPDTVVVTGAPLLENTDTSIPPTEPASTAAQATQLSDTPTAVLPEPTPTVPPTPEPRPRPMIGVETHGFKPVMVPLFASAGINLVRRNALFWHLVEAQEGERNWQAVAVLEEELKLAASSGLDVILIIRSSPLWAQKVAGSYCSAVREDKFEAFASFLQAAVERYSAPPFNVRYWELGNEPDVDPAVVPLDSNYGCWGDPNEEYYGGEYYARMLAAAYPAIKAADPHAQVLIGGLLLDCDPTNPPENNTCQSAYFFEGILRQGGAEFFDIVSFHGYPVFAGEIILDENYQSWNVRGGIVSGKANFLREIMSQYGVNKPLMHTEGSLICPEWGGASCNPAGPSFFEAQGDYAVWMYLRNWAEGIAATVWYQFEGPGWRSSGLTGKNLASKPAYEAMVFMHQELKDAQFVERISDYPDLRGFAFIGAGKRIWVLLSPDQTAHTISLPPGVTRIYDKYGVELTPVGDTLEIKSPVYIELEPLQ